MVVTHETYPQRMLIVSFAKIALVSTRVGGLSKPHVDAYELGIETAREELSILTVLSKKFGRASIFRADLRPTRVQAKRYTWRGLLPARKRKWQT